MPGGPGRAAPVATIAEHRLARQRVAEHEPASLDRHHLGAEGGTEGIEHDPHVDVSDLGDELPIEVAPEDCGGTDDSAVDLIERRQAALDRLAEIERHRRGEQTRRHPADPDRD